MTDSKAFVGELASLQKSSNGSFSLLLVDVGYTGKIVARFGYDAGDLVLHRAADLLGKICRSKDRVSRIGESTFALILAGIRDPGHAALAAEKIVRLQKVEIDAGKPMIRLDMRIGIANCPYHSSDPVDLIHKARIALESARASKKSFITYSADAAATMASKWALQDELATAIQEDKLELNYQPKIITNCGQPAGAEALMRWTSTLQGPVSPNVFVPLAEELGLMEKLSWFAVNTALRQTAEWPDIGVPLSVSVNVDLDTLQGDEVVDMVKSALSIWESDNRKLILEITERALVTQSESNFATLNELRDAGVGISIDDFGTGYSSLSYFKDIPATELKIDKSFVSNMLNEDMDRNIVESIIWLAHRFNLSVVAEGVEDFETLNMLAEMDCDLTQGFVVARPLSHSGFVDWLVE